MRVLGIESSCDETAAAVVDSGKILSDIVATQHDVHEKYGGVVPELASRRHIENMVPLVMGALDRARLNLDDIDGVAVTCAPGLLGALLAGISMAKGIAYAREIPLIGVNHLEGHLNAAELEFGQIQKPCAGLVVSGGHTSIYLIRKFGDYRLIGATRDDAAGEAFDKVAKLLNLGYPGGPAIERISSEGDPYAFAFKKPKFSNRTTKGTVPRPFDFSFSGIKTAILNLYRKEARGEKGVSKQFIADLASSFQESVARILTETVIEAARERGAKTCVMAGGVASNARLRELLKDKADAAGLGCHIPSPKLCTDNAAMIAYVGGKYLEMGRKDDFTLDAVANQEIGT